MNILLPNLKTRKQREDYLKRITFGAWIWESENNKLVGKIEIFGNCACGFFGMATAKEVPKKYQFCNIYEKTGAIKNIGEIPVKKKEYIKSICKTCIINQVEVLE